MEDELFIRDALEDHYEHVRNELLDRHEQKMLKMELSEAARSAAASNTEKGKNQ